MISTKYPVHITIKRSRPIQITPEFEAFIDFVMDEWEEHEYDKVLRREIESDIGLNNKLELMRKKL